MEIGTSLQLFKPRIASGFGITAEAQASDVKGALDGAQWRAGHSGAPVPMATALERHSMRCAIMTAPQQAQPNARSKKRAKEPSAMC
jgi:hypothetical protein